MRNTKAGFAAAGSKQSVSLAAAITFTWELLGGLP